MRILSFILVIYFALAAVPCGAADGGDASGPKEMCGKTAAILDFGYEEPIGDGSGFCECPNCDQFESVQQILITGISTQRARSADVAVVTHRPVYSASFTGAIWQPPEFR